MQEFDKYKLRGTLSNSFWKKNKTLIENLSTAKDVDLRLRGGLIHAYYAGGKILEIRESTLKVDEKYLRNFSEKDKIIKKWFLSSQKDDKNRFTLNRDKVLKNTGQYLHTMKRVMEAWFGENEKAERSHQQLIAMATHPDLQIVDIEFAVSYNSHCYNPAYMTEEKKKTDSNFEGYKRWPNPRFDIIGIDSAGQIYVFELKTGLNSLGNMEKHVTDFVNLIGSESPDAGGVIRFRAFNEEMQTIISEFNLHSASFAKSKIPDVNLALPPKFFFLFTHKEDKNEFWDFQHKVDECFAALKNRPDGEMYEALVSRGILNKKAIYSAPCCDWAIHLNK